MVMVFHGLLNQVKYMSSVNSFQNYSIDIILYYMKSSLATVWDKYILIFMGIGLIPVRGLIEKFGGLELKFSIGIYFFFVKFIEWGRGCFGRSLNTPPLVGPVCYKDFSG